MTRQDVEDDVGRVDAMANGFGAGRLDRAETVGQHRGKDLDHLAIAAVRGLQPASHALQVGRQQPVLEGRAIPQGARLAGKHRHVMPGVVDRLVAAE
jgi:hypothetical protein